MEKGEVARSEGLSDSRSLLPRASPTSRAHLPLLASTGTGRRPESRPSATPSPRRQRPPLLRHHRLRWGQRNQVAWAAARTGERFLVVDFF